MTVHPALLHRIHTGRWAVAAGNSQTVLRGLTMLRPGDPRCWEEIVGQEAAVARLQAAVAHAQNARTRLDHTLLASGMAGVGKTTLARVIAVELGVGIVEVSGPVTLDEARSLLRSMRDGDILFWDEIHLAVAGGKAKAEWLLPLMESGHLATARGREPVPDITIIGATTDAGSLPRTILGRFPVQPVLTPLDAEHIVVLVNNFASRMELEELPAEVSTAVAEASNGEPRQMKALLTALRDGGGWDMEQALTWCGLSADGLTETAADFLVVLMGAFDGVASLATISAALNEPGPLRHVEQTLSQRGYIRVTAKGRELTDTGMARAIELAVERGYITQEA
jgi:Holliday junction DNA helicase RuvB